MKVSEEIEALEVMAINPVQFLVVPRFLAMMVMLPALTGWGNDIGILCGWVVCRFALDFNTAGYILRCAGKRGNLGFVFGNDQERRVRVDKLSQSPATPGSMLKAAPKALVRRQRLQSCKLCLPMLVMNAVLTGIFFFAA